jgi:hypothetical protein
VLRRWYGYQGYDLEEIQIVSSRRRLLVTITTCLIIGSAGLFVIIPGMFSEYRVNSNNTLEWANIGNLTIYCEFSIYACLTSEEIMDYWYPLNRTRIGITIDYLPTLDGFITAKGFIDDIANTDKIRIWSEEDLEIKFSLRILLEKVISILVFPKGDWEFLENTFGEEVMFVTQSDQMTRSFSFVGGSRNAFTYEFNRNMTQHTDGVGTYRALTSGIIDNGTGIPTHIEHSWNFQTADGFGYYIEIKYLS